MQLKPLQSNILCSVHEGGDSAIVLPEGVNANPYAKVLALGPDCKFIAVGDHVLFHPSNATFADKIDGQQVVIAPEAACFAKYEATVTPIKS